MQRRKRWGDKGSPCLISLDGKIGSKGIPLNKTEVDTDETTHNKIYKVLGRFVLKSISLMKLHSNL